MGGVGEAAILEGIPKINAEKQAGRAGSWKSRGSKSFCKRRNGKPKRPTALHQHLTAHPNIRGLFAANDNMALGALQAINAAGRSGQIAITSYDNLQAVQQAILEGKIISTIEQHPELMGAYGVRAAKDHLDGKEVPDRIDTPLDVIDYRYLSLKKK